MPRDGSGDFSRTEGPYINGQVADADEMNNEMDDMAAALSDSLNKAGTKAMAANLPMGGFKVTGLGAGSVNGDSVRYEQLTAAVATLQPLDATLTALAALAWSSGQNFVKFTAADTVALSNELAQATVPLTLTNNADSASVQGLIVQGDRATPATNDQVYISYYLSDASGSQDEMGRISLLASNITNGAEESQFRYSVLVGGVLTTVLLYGPFYLAPASNDALTLGTAASQWSDLFLAEGGVINWDNGDAVLTQTGNVLELTGAGMAAPLVQVAGVGGETLAAATHRNRQLLLDGDITLDDGLFAAGDWHVFTCDGTNRTITRAAGLVMRVNGTDSATATITANTTGGAVWVTASEVHLTGSGIS